MQVNFFLPPAPPNERLSPSSCAPVSPNEMHTAIELKWMPISMICATEVILYNVCDYMLLGIYVVLLVVVTVQGRCNLGRIKSNVAWTLALKRYHKMSMSDTRWARKLAEIPSAVPFALYCAHGSVCKLLSLVRWDTINDPFLIQPSSSPSFVVTFLQEMTWQNSYG